jgi:hypothetical protein
VLEVAHVVGAHEAGSHSGGSHAWLELLEAAWLELACCQEASMVRPSC